MDLFIAECVVCKVDYVAVVYFICVGKEKSFTPFVFGLGLFPSVTW